MPSDIPLLRAETLYPSNEVLNDVLCDSYVVFESLSDKATKDLGLGLEWSFYKDQRSWLCKVSYKKKTVFWLSVWDKFFKATFFFSERHLEGFAGLDIAESIKEDLCMAKPIGKLLPLLLNINHQEQLDDLLKIIAFKKNLK